MLQISRVLGKLSLKMLLIFLDFSIFIKPYFFHRKNATKTSFSFYLSDVKARKNIIIRARWKKLTIYTENGRDKDNCINWISSWWTNYYKRNSSEVVKSNKCSGEGGYISRLPKFYFLPQNLLAADSPSAFLFINPTQDLGKPEALYLLLSLFY